MDIEATDGAVLIYTFGVMVSALWLSSPEQSPTLTPFIVALFGVTSIGWTAYFKWKIAPQYAAEDEDEEEESDEEDLTPPTAGK